MKLIKAARAAAEVAAEDRRVTEFEIETEPGVRLGQQVLPLQCAGCLVPGGRHAYDVFTGRQMDILVGPGDAYVAEAKWLMFTEVVPVNAVGL